MLKEELIQQAQETIKDETVEDSIKKLEEAGKEYEIKSPTTFFISNNPLAKKINSVKQQQNDMFNKAIEKKFTKE